VSDQVSHPYRTTDKIIFLYILIFIFLVPKKWSYCLKYGVSGIYDSAPLGCDAVCWVLCSEHI
jgi:hypothetical protein